MLRSTCGILPTVIAVRPDIPAGMRNFDTQPPRPAWDAPLAIYHALPHGLRDDLGQLITPDLCINTLSVLDRKREMLACHRSQKEWLDVSQGMNAYLHEMERLSTEVGRLSGCFTHAEGWRRHSTLGFAPNDFNPLKTLIQGNYNATTAE